MIIPAKLLPLETPIAGCGMVCSFMPPMYAACTAAVSRKSMVLLVFALPSLPCCSVHPSVACVDRHLLAGGAPVASGLVSSAIPRLSTPRSHRSFFRICLQQLTVFPTIFPTDGGLCVGAPGPTRSRYQWGSRGNRIFSCGSLPS